MPFLSEKIEKARAKLKDAKEKVHPEKLLISTALGSVSPAVLVVLQTFLTIAVHEVGEDFTDSEMRSRAVEIIVLLNVVSVALEAKVLHDRLYSASIFSTIFKVMCERPILIATIMHLLNFAQMIVVNPVQLYNLPKLVSGEGSRLFFENALAVTIALTAWKLVANGLLLQFDSSVLRLRAGSLREKVKRYLSGDFGDDFDYIP